MPSQTAVALSYVDLGALRRRKEKDKNVHVILVMIAPIDRWIITCWTHDEKKTPKGNPRNARGFCKRAGGGALYKLKFRSGCTSGALSNKFLLSFQMSRLIYAREFNK